ncbi:keratin, type II cytoskeletal 8-like isoform X1 [Thunnus maccoyii]|uniref:keratin, type II cytoskeletal 8-like isoform X1 n=2 Tax=Thunnus maccoyii TaxID=8240 RepID=UPI001C4D3A80|nr:keratin, type II cytoskeletal 8-like isoform X1 [Thunnus maccoyii]
MSKPRDYSSQTYSPSGSGPAKSYPTNKKIDPSGKSKEKDDMVGLNDKFVRLIDKMKQQEDENQKLDTKLKILKEQEDYEGKVDDIVKQLENELEQQIENLLRDQEKLKAELLKNQEEVEDTKKNYEDELKKRAERENEFVVTKKEVDEGQLDLVDQALDLEDLVGKLDFRRAGFDEEIKELQSHIQNETVVLRDSSKRSLDMDEIIESVKKQYANMAARTREEAEIWNQRKMDVMVTRAGQREQEVRDLKRELSDMVRLIQKLNGDLETLTRKEESLKKDITDAVTEGDQNLEKSRETITQLEEALRRAKQDLARQIREYQELINLKLGLDIEIATYRKLLEGEEQRMREFMRQADVHLLSKKHLPERPRTPEPTVVPPTTTIPATTHMYPASKKRLLIRVEVEEGRVVSESSYYTEG